MMLRSLLLLSTLLFLLPCQATPSLPSSPQASTSAPSAEKRYWVTKSSGKTHNARCRYYETSKGYHSSSGTGNNCKLCGGAAR